MDERRLIPRWQVRQEAKVWMPQTQDFSHCFIEDINLKGMCITSRKKLFAEPQVRMSFAIGESFELIRVEADVSWVNDNLGRFTYGLYFKNIADPDRGMIDQYINIHCYDQMKQNWWM